jgi:hypothetical protein
LGKTLLPEKVNQTDIFLLNKLARFTTNTFFSLQVQRVQLKAKGNQKLHRSTLP